MAQSTGERKRIGLIIIILILLTGIMVAASITMADEPVIEPAVDDQGILMQDVLSGNSNPPKVVIGEVIADSEPLEENETGEMTNFADPVQNGAGCTAQILEQHGGNAAKIIYIYPKPGPGGEHGGEPYHRRSVDNQPSGASAVPINLSDTISANNATVSTSVTGNIDISSSGDVLTVDITGGGEISANGSLFFSCYGNWPFCVEGEIATARSGYNLRVELNVPPGHVVETVEHQVSMFEDPVVPLANHTRLYQSEALYTGGQTHEIGVQDSTSVCLEISSWNPRCSDQIGHEDLGIWTAFEPVSRTSSQRLKVICKPLPILTGLEVTQAVQNLSNDVDLVAGKKTFVRAHVKSGGASPMNNVKVKLHGKRNGSDLPGSPLSPISPGSRGSVKPDPERGKIGDSFLFELPDSWTQGSVELTLTRPNGQVDSLNCQEPAEDVVGSITGDCIVKSIFIDIPELEVIFVPIPWYSNIVPTNDDIKDIVQDIEAQLPIPKLKYFIAPPMDNWRNEFLPPGTLGASWDLSDVLLQLKEDYSKKGRIAYGVLADPRGVKTLGRGYRPGWQSAGFYDPNKLAIAAHEFGHNLGSRHTYSSCRPADKQPKKYDKNYPFPDGKIGSVLYGPEKVHYGFNIKTKKILPPHTSELMGYCPPLWISEYNYENMLERLIDVETSLLNKAQFSVAALGDPVVTVGGFINIEENSGTIESVLQVEAPENVTLPNTGSYSISFEDDLGSELAAYSFSPDVAEDELGEYGSYSLLLPWDAASARVVLLYNGTELASRSASGNAPSVSLTSPPAGELWDSENETISWTATDDDGDSLIYKIQYRSNSASEWVTLVGNNEGNSYTVDRTMLPGSDSAAIRILTSDGFHTASDVVEPLTVITNPPEITITSPDQDDFFVGNQSIFFEAFAYDREDGMLEGSALDWRSDLDGSLGSGSRVQLDASTLAEGTHLITLSATDSDGQSVQATTTIDVYRDWPVLPATLSVAPFIFSFTSPEGYAANETQMVSVDNTGDGDLAWTASTSETWIVLGTTSGNAPENVPVTVDPAGLAPGEYQGEITISSADAGNSPQSITVLLDVYPAAVQTIQLDPGWHLVSSFPDPANRDIAEIFSTIQNQMVLAKNDRGQIYWPEFGIDQIEHWDLRDGYQVYLNESAQLAFDGYATDPGNLGSEREQGWHTIGYWLDSEMPVQTALASLADQLVLVKNDTGDVYWPEMSIIDLQTMVPGEGYKIYLSAPGSLVYPDSGG